MEMEQFDVSTAFLHGNLEEIIFVEPPEGLNIDKERSCLLLRKSLYGLKQAPKSWNSKFDETMKLLDFRSILSDKCVYISEIPKIIVAVYVDDGVMMAQSRKICLNVIRQLNQHFTTKRMHNNMFLGTEIVQSATSVTPGHTRYAKEATVDRVECSKVTESK